MTTIDTTSREHNTVEPVAIIGMSCRLPGGVENPSDFWRLLCDGVDPIAEVPADRWNLKTIYDEDRARKGKAYVRQAGFISHFDEFDAPFFGISRREAECMDPQQRWLLEVAWEAFESAGLPTEKMSGSETGVFVGLFTRDFETLQLSSVNRDLIDAHTGVGTSMGIAANRISYAFNLTGPSLTIDTACSSAMVALHYACQSLRAGECTVALAGGVNALLRAEMTIATSKASMLSVDGRSKSFDASANGYVRSEGVGLVVLKPLARAIADGDPILAVIRGTAVNQDGRSKGLTVPSGAAQERALRAALAAAGVNGASVQYVEAHGTGTPVGDPIESTALGNVLGLSRPAGSKLIMGSVKSNLGHTESAAGVVSLIKVALALNHRAIPPNLHFHTPNPNIPFEQLQLQVPTQLLPWPDPGDGPRRAVINSFGFGGTNGSMVVDEAPVPEQAGPVATRRHALLLPLSASTPEALRAMTSRMSEFCAQSTATIDDICFTASVRRSHLQHRAAIVVSSFENLQERLQSILSDEIPLGATTGEVADTLPAVVFVFSGMGPQWWAMGRELIQQEPLFRAQIEEIDVLFHSLSGWSILAEMLAAESASRMEETCVAQPAIFSLQVGLATLWRSLGVVPAAIVGHSVGEVAAAYVSGALTLPDAVRTIYHRSRLQQTTAGSGTMLAVGLSPLAAEREIAPVADRVSIAAINSPQAITLAGDAAELRSIAHRLSDCGKFQKFLQVEVPYHSPGMNGIEAELLSSLANLQPRQTTVPLYSTVTGAPIDGATLDATYWWRNVRNTVLFSNAIGALSASGLHYFLEIGPHPVLSRNIEQCVGDQYAGVTVLSSLRRYEPERANILAAAGALYCSGYPLKWECINVGRFVRLPDYPWQRERYWMETDESASQRLGAGTTFRGSGLAVGQEEHPLLGGRLNVTPALQVWESAIDLSRLTYLDDHRIQNTVVYPGAAYVEMAVAAAHTSAVRELVFHNPLFLGSAPAKLQLSLVGTQFEVHSEREGSWVLHASGQTDASAVALPAEPPVFSAEIAWDGPAVYERFAHLGLRYGPKFQAIQQLAVSGNHVWSTLTETTSAEGYLIHPTVLDGVFQTLLGAVLNEEQRGVYLPTGIGSIQIASTAAATGPLTCFAHLQTRTASEIEGDIELYQGNQCRLVVRSLRCVFQPRPRAEQPYDALLYLHRWVEQTLPTPTTTPGGSWLIVSEHHSAAAAEIAQQLLSSGAMILGIVQPAHVRASVSGFPAAQPLDHILQIASNEPASMAEPSAECLCLIDCVQALAGRTPRLWIVTRGGQSIAGEGVAITHAALWALARVIAQEHPELRCTRIDLDAATPFQPGRVLNEIRVSGAEEEIAWRGDTRYVLRLDRFTPSPAGARLDILPDATYLITGGAGGLGLVFARHLLARGARHLVLTGRRGGAGQEATLAGLRSNGADVRAIAADIGNPDDVRRLIASIDSEMPPLRGILHGAAVIDDGVLRQQTADRFRNVWHPKAAGAWCLHQELGHRTLDFFVLFSSVASLTGSAGQGIYAAANGFLDGLAHLRRSLGLSALSLNWGPWAEVGAATKGDILERLEDRGLAGLKPGECLAAFDELIGQPVPQVGVCAFDWPRFLDKFPGAQRPFYAMQASQAQPRFESGQRFLDQLLTLDPGDQEPALQHFVRQELVRVLRLKSPDHVKPRQRLFELGMDSLTSVELGGRMQSELGIRLPSTVMFDFPTVEALSNFLVSTVLRPAPAEGHPAIDVAPLLEFATHSLGEEGDPEAIADLLRLELDAGWDGR